MGEVRWNKVVTVAFLDLLRCSLSGREPDRELFRSLSPERWQELYALVEDQTMIAVCYPLVEQLPKDCLPPRELLFEWLGDYELIVRQYGERLNVGRELVDRLEKEGLSPMIMKGWAFAQYYPDPALRMSGDIDFYIPGGYEKIPALLRQWGDGATKVGHHDTMEYKGVHVEFHASLINPPLASVAEEREYIRLEGLWFPVPGRDANLMLMLTHMARHMMSYGFSFRHLYDFMLMWRKYEGVWDKEVLKRQLQEVGIDPFFDALMLIGKHCLGLEHSFFCRPVTHREERLARFLMEDMLEQGDTSRMFSFYLSRMTEEKNTFVKVFRWVRYYGYSLKRLNRLRALWPKYAIGRISMVVGRRVGYLLKGRPFEV